MTRYGALGLLIGAFSAAFMPVDAQAALCNFGPGTPGEPSLQTVINQSLTQPLNTSMDCVAEGDDDQWRAFAGATATVVVEIAGFASSNRFGIYDLEDPNKRLQIFAGQDDVNTLRKLNFGLTQNGDYRFEIRQLSGSLVGSAVFASDLFGFYITTPQGSGHTYYSDSSLNPDGVDHMYAYAGNNSIFKNNSTVPRRLRGTTFAADMYLLAWEDLLNGGDFDYQDMVILTSSMAPVPLPAALALLCSGLLLLPAAVRRRTSREAAV
jgi:hypothetical protein